MSDTDPENLKKKLFEYFTGTFEVSELDEDYDLESAVEVLALLQRVSAPREAHHAFIKLISEGNYTKATIGLTLNTSADDQESYYLYESLEKLALENPYRLHMLSVFEKSNPCTKIV